MSFWDKKRLEEEAKQRRLEQDKKRQQLALQDKKRKKALAEAAEARKQKWIELKKKHSADSSNYDFKSQDYQSEYADINGTAQPDSKKSEAKLSRGFGNLNTANIKKLSEGGDAEGKSGGERNLGPEIEYPKLPRPI